MSDFSNWLIPESFMPHGHCYLWEPALLRQIVISNAVVGLAYFGIPLALIYFVKKRKDVQFNGIFFMFSAFIFACGTTHFMNIFTIWRPAYRLDATIMSITALVSIGTLVMLLRLMPQLLSLPSPTMLKETIKELEQQNALRIKAEDELKKLNAELDAKVVQRTQDLTESNKQLNIVQKVLELNLNDLTKINQELNNFAYAASHDLKSPLRGIDQLASWIEEDVGDTLSGESLQHLRLMRSRITRMEMLLDDLLAYSRVGRTSEEVEPVNTRELVENIFEMEAPEKSIELVLAEDMPVFNTQKVPLELVFRNLISNAIKHHDKPQGKISITVSKNDNVFEFAVTDDGPGILPEHQRRVFDIFQTLKPRDEVEGSGMGLALVKKSVESMGGVVTLESDGQHGCTIRFTWPVNLISENV